MLNAEVCCGEAPAHGVSHADDIAEHEPGTRNFKHIGARSTLRDAMARRDWVLEELKGWKIHYSSKTLEA